MINYQDEKVVIIGLGITGISCINFFLRRGIKPLVMDTRFSPPCLKKLPVNIQYHLGSLNEDWLLKSTLIVVSPGIFVKSYPVLIKAADNGISIVSDIELFVREAKAPIVAITGSNGKSTVTSMVSKMAISAGWQIGVGGNIGLPALKLLELPSCQLYILELSSFQLENTYSLKAKVATVLNISDDHMDRYPFGLKEYQAVKLKIYQNAETCVFNVDDVLTMPIWNYYQQMISFGIKQGDYHLDQHASNTWLIVNGKPLISSFEMIINGHHNYTNALAALALANAIGLPQITSLEALKQFRGLKHRFELVHERHSVRWINDSKATNIGSTQAALNSIKKITGNLHLLLGGDSKSADFTPLLPLLQSNWIQLYFFGRDAKKLASLLSKSVNITETMKQAIIIISKQLKAGDVVLLSPACSSLDQFNNFEMRGKVFTRLAQELG